MPVSISHALPLAKVLCCARIHMSLTVSTKTRAFAHIDTLSGKKNLRICHYDMQVTEIRAQACERMHKRERPFSTHKLVKPGTCL